MIAVGNNTSDFVKIIYRKKTLYTLAAKPFFYRNGALVE